MIRSSNSTQRRRGRGEEKAEIRRPKSEGRNPKEIRNPNHKRRRGKVVVFSGFELWICFGFWVSDFLRIHCVSAWNWPPVLNPNSEVGRDGALRRPRAVQARNQRWTSRFSVTIRSARWTRAGTSQRDVTTKTRFMRMVPLGAVRFIGRAPPELVLPRFKAEIGRASCRERV